VSQKPTKMFFLPLVLRNYTPPESQYPWTGYITHRLSNCGLTRLFGFALDSSGGLKGDAWIHVWADAWDGFWIQSQWTNFGAGTPYTEDDGNWDAIIDVGPRAGTWRVCVVPGQGRWDCISNTVDAITSSDCQNGYQVIHITFQEN